ncbi:MAG: helix-turn-helix domain-containing protein [Saprospiraceae bacterium]|nr:helix-turn-helix domain-containing protein [Saprospiraceae bacterium]
MQNNFSYPKTTSIDYVIVTDTKLQATSLGIGFIWKRNDYYSTRKMSISEISEQLGFDSASYFTTFFKKKFTLTPEEFRSKNL